MLYSRPYLQRRGPTLIKARGLLKTAQRVLKEDAHAAGPHATFDIFLSHAHIDADSILALAEDMRALDYSVYVDFEIDALVPRTYVSRHTAAMLRRRMRQCRSLLFALTPGASASKWMPWELGYFDGLRGRVAILPVLTSEQPGDTFSGQEYLGLYPYVSREPDTAQRTRLWINDRKPTVFVHLRDWLGGTQPRPH